MIWCSQAADVVCFRCSFSLMASPDDVIHFKLLLGCISRDVVMLVTQQPCQGVPFGPEDCDTLLRDQKKLICGP